MNTIVVKVNDTVKNISEHKVITQDGKPTIIKAVDKVNYELLDESTGYAPHHIVTKRVNNDLHVSFEESSENSELIMEGFYDGIDSALTGIAEDGNYYYYIPNTGEVTDFVTELQLGEVQGQALGGEEYATPWWVGATAAFNGLPWLAGLAGLGLAGAALSGGGSDDGDTGANGLDGANGKSALELWQEIPGNENKDLNDFITSLKGANGTNGKSALELLIEAGELPAGSDTAALIAYLKGADGADGLTPEIGTNGNWFIGTTDTGIAATGDDGLTPTIGTNGNWFIGTTDTGVVAAGADGQSALELLIDAGELDEDADVNDMIAYLKGEAGENGLTPEIGTNGNWFIGTTDTGIAATGDDGLTPTIGTNGNWFIGTTDTGVVAAGADGQSALELLIAAGELDEDADVNDMIAYLKGEAGENGLTPEIGTNGNWFIGTTDTGIAATGDDGQDGDNIPFVNILEGDDAYITGSDLIGANQVEVAITLPDDAQANDILTVNGVNTTITQDMIDNGFITSIDVPDSGTLFVRATVTFADGSQSGTGKDFARVGLIARDDLDELELGSLQVVQQTSYSDSDLELVGLTPGTGSTENNLSFTVSEGTNGTVSIEVTQTALLTVADAVNIEVYDSSGNRIYVGTTGGNPLIGNVVGLELLGLTGNDTLTATVSGLEPGAYNVVVRNDPSELERLVNELSLAELGEAGVVLGPNNQDVVFTTIENALGTVVGGTVNGLLLTALTAAGGEGLGLDVVVDILEDSVLGLGVLDPLLNDIAAALLSNTVTLLGTTDIEATLTELAYADDKVISGNVIDPDALLSDEPGEDTVTPNAILTAIKSNNNSQSSSTSTEVGGLDTLTIEGQYGVLVIDENGDYTYTANGDYASLDQLEVFTYTISNGITSDTAELIIDIGDMTPPDAPTINSPIAGDDVVNIQEAADGFNITGTGEVGAIITLTDETGDVIGTATVGADGNWSASVDQADVAAMDQGAETITVIATDSSGNVSSSVTADITVDTEAPIATDDQGYAGLEVDPIITQPPYNGTAGGLLNLSALGGLTISALSTASAFNVTVTADQQLSLTLDGSGSVVAVVGTPDLDLLVYQVDNETGNITLFDQQADWFDFTRNTTAIGTPGPGGTWSANDLEIATLTGGTNGASATYYFVLGSDSSSLLGLALLPTMNVVTVSSQLIDSDNFNTVVSTGNVITNDNGDGQTMTVTSVDGIDVSGSTIIGGAYGDLVIDANGAYTYTPDEDASGIDQTDNFSYTINDGNGNTATATLSIVINSDGQAPAAGRMSASSFTLADDTDDAIELPDISLITSSEGLDVLSFEGADQVISLTDLIQPETIDIIDISGIGANTLNVAAEDVDSAIYVRGDNDDTVNLEGDDWSTVGQTASSGETYDPCRQIRTHKLGRF